MTESSDRLHLDQRRVALRHQRRVVRDCRPHGSWQPLGVVDETGDVNAPEVWPQNHSVADLLRPVGQGDVDDAFVYDEWKFKKGNRSVEKMVSV
jgi:hypothetical protein